MTSSYILIWPTDLTLFQAQHEVSALSFIPTTRAVSYITDCLFSPHGLRLGEVGHGPSVYWYVMSLLLSANDLQSRGALLNFYDNKYVLILISRNILKYILSGQDTCPTPNYGTKYFHSNYDVYFINTEIVVQ